MMWIGKYRYLSLIVVGLYLVAMEFLAPVYTSALTNSDDFTRCDACHIQEHEELSRTYVHKTIKCTSCHNITDFAPDLYSHNATTFACIYCHIPQNSTQFNVDAHYNFSNASNATNIFTNSNEMCVACHTYIENEIEWHSYKGMNITAAINLNGTWSLDYSGYGENVTRNYTNYTDFLNTTNRT